MMDFNQGDIIKINDYKNCLFVIVSKNAFIKATGVFHVCPLLTGIAPGPTHIKISGMNATQGIVICEQIKFIDPKVRACSRKDSLPYEYKIDVSDCVQGIFEYD